MNEEADELAKLRYNRAESNTNLNNNKKKSLFFNLFYQRSYSMVMSQAKELVTIMHTHIVFYYYISVKLIDIRT